MPKHTIEELSDALAYNHETGDLTWKITKFKGRVAGGIWSDGYKYFRFGRTLYLAHRVAFAIYYGRWPKIIDHVNCDKSDNRIENLREATVTENNRNRGKQSNNTTGFKGVSLHKSTGKFAAKITCDKQTKSLGHFSTPEEASAAYIQASKELHNEFAHG